MADAPLAAAGSTVQPADVTSLLPYGVGGGGLAAVLALAFFLRRGSKPGPAVPPPATFTTTSTPSPAALPPAAPRPVVIAPNQAELEAVIKQRADVEAAKRAEVAALASTAARQSGDGSR